MFCGKIWPNGSSALFADRQSLSYVFRSVVLFHVRAELNATLSNLRQCIGEKIHFSSALCVALGIQHGALCFHVRFYLQFSSSF